MTKFVDVLFAFKDSNEKEVEECISEACAGEDCPNPWIFTMYVNPHETDIHWHACKYHLREWLDDNLESVFQFQMEE